MSQGRVDAIRPARAVSGVPATAACSRRSRR